MSFALGFVVFGLRTDGRGAVTVGFGSRNGDIGDIVVVLVVDLNDLHRV